MRDQPMPSQVKEPGAKTQCGSEQSQRQNSGPAAGAWIRYCNAQVVRLQEVTAQRQGQLLRWGNLTGSRLACVDFFPLSSRHWLLGILKCTSTKIYNIFGTIFTGSGSLWEFDPSGRSCRRPRSRARLFLAELVNGFGLALATRQDCWLLLQEF